MITLKNGLVFINNEFVKKDIVIDNGIITEIGDNLSKGDIKDCSNLLLAPSFADPHVHLREPGYEYKETIFDGTRAAARGGYTKIFLMPNLKPNPGTKEGLEKELKAIKKDAIITCYPIGSITKNGSGEGEIADIDDIYQDVIGLSDDGRGVYRSNTMYEAMLKAKKYNLPIISHSEDKDLLYGGVIHQGEFSKRNNIKGIIGISETVEMARNLVIAKNLGVHFHMCHISCKDSVELIRAYKKMGANVSCEVCPHHLILIDEDIDINDGNFKMNPPLMSKDDRASLIEGLLDGTIDCIATDHAPHSVEEKSKGMASMFGIVGIETSFPLMYTHFVKKNIMSLEMLLNKMSKNVLEAFNIKTHDIVIGNEANIVGIDLNKEYVIDKEKFISKGRNTPFNGWKVFGNIELTICKGEIVYELH